MKTLPLISIVTSQNSSIICYCGHVSKGQILEAIAKGNHTFEQLRQEVGVCPENCDCAVNNPDGRCCAPEVMALVKAYAPGAADAVQSASCSCCEESNSRK